MVLWSEIRRRILAGELSLRQACSAYHLNFRTIQKIVRSAEPAAYSQTRPRAKPVLGPFLGVVHRILEQDRSAPPKQRHTARRIFERLRDEHHYQGCASIVRAAVADWKLSTAEVFVPLLHPPGEAQCDFGRAEVSLGGVAHKAALFVLTLPHSNARFAVLSPRECCETFHEGHARAFAFFGGVPTRIRYDNSRLAVVKLTDRHERQLSHEFLRLAAHFGFAHVFCGPRRPQEKGHVENGVGYVRRNFLVPVPAADSWEQLNDRLSMACQRELGRATGRDNRPTAALLAVDRGAFLPLPAEPFSARRTELVTINSLSLGRFDGNDYSVPVALAHRTLSATGNSDSVHFSHQGQVVAVHRRCWGKGQVTFEPLHYLALLEHKPFAFDSARPLQGWQLPDCFAVLRKRLEDADPREGTRQYVRVLRLLESHDLETVRAAVTAALRLAVADADAVRLLLEKAQERPTANFDVNGRPQLSGVQVPPVDLSVYTVLTSAGRSGEEEEGVRRKKTSEIR
jgi:transposase